MKIITGPGLTHGMYRGNEFRSISIRDKFPRGLTFYKNFTNIPNNTYAFASFGSLLNADFALGSPVATFTSTNGNFVINGGYQATTANDEVLKYLIAGNRTAAQETIVIKFTPTGDFANDGVNRYLTTTDTKQRRIYKYSNANQMYFNPNANDNSSVVAVSGIAYLNGVSYLIASVCKHATNPVATTLFYSDGVLKNSDTTHGDYTTNAWGSSFTVGCYSDGSLQFEGIIEKIMIFNRDLSASEIINLS